MNLKTHIAASGKTRVTICKEVGVSRQTLYKIESGQHKPKIELACRLAKSIGCHLDVIRPDLEGIIS